MKQLSNHLYQLSLGFVNAFVLADSDGLTLIDTGMPGSTDKIIKAFKKAGQDPAAIRRIILTHAHTDHAGSAAELSSRLAIPVWAHDDTASLVESGVPGRFPMQLAPGFVNAIVYHLVIKGAPKTIAPVHIDRRLGDGEILPIAGGLRVIHTPGHAEGHLSFLVVQDSFLIAADICANAAGLDYSTVYENRETGRQSILKAAAFGFDKAAFGHGRPLTHSAGAVLQKKFSGPPLG